MISNTEFRIWYNSEDSAKKRKRIIYKLKFITKIYNERRKKQI